MTLPGRKPAMQFAIGHRVRVDLSHLTVEQAWRKIRFDAGQMKQGVIVHKNPDNTYVVLLRQEIMGIDRVTVDAGRLRLESES